MALCLFGRSTLPQTSDLRPQTSDPRPQTSDLGPQTSDFRPRTYAGYGRRSWAASIGKCQLSLGVSGIFGLSGLQLIDRDYANYGVRAFRLPWQYLPIPYRGGGLHHHVPQTGCR